MKKAWNVSGIMLTLLFMGMLALAFNIQSVESKTIIVPDDYLTIQEAINAASPGDTIYVRAGTYYENVVVNKSVSLIGENKVTTTVDGNMTATVVAVTADNVTISEFTVRNGGDRYAGISLSSNGNNITNNILWNNWCGINLERHTSYNLIANNSITNNLNGVHGELWCDSTIVGNDIMDNLLGIWVGPYSMRNTIVSNDIRNQWSEGVSMWQSSYNTIVGNNITDNNQGGHWAGIVVGFSSYNEFFHNNIVNKGKQIDVQGEVVNTWDDGYPSGGNYWSDYTGVDLYSGVYQNETVSDGIGDTPYVIDADNRDRYPLINPVAEHYIDVPFYYQVETYYCGPAALQMVFDFYGENISQFEIADVARTVPYVTYTDELRRAAHFSNVSTSMGSEMPENITGYTARKLGYAAFEMGGTTLDDLKSLIDQDFPIILLMRWVPEEEYGHYRVAIGYNKTHVFLHDPWNNIEWGGDYGGPNLTMNYTFFLDMWNYMGNWSLFVSPWRVIIDMPRDVYVGQRFTVTANITYICPSPFSSYEYPASSCNATITLLEGLTLADSEKATKNIGNLQAGDTAQAFWTVEAKHSENHSLAIEAEGKISGFVGEKPDVGPSYDYQDRIGGYSSSLVTATTASQIYIRGIDPTQGFPGTKVLVFGGGATPNGTVVALLSEPIIGNTTVGWTTADMGYWEIPFTVPNVSPGNYTVYAVDNETSTSDAIGFGVLAAQVGIRIRYVSPSAGTLGTPVYLSGDGATVYGEVRIYFDNVSIANTTAYMASGWSVSLTVPDVKPGNYTITALDVASNTTDTIMFTVTPPPTIYVSPQEAPIGTKITVSGEGFSPGTGIYVAFEDLIFFTPIYIDDDGEFNATVFVPVVNSGNYTIKAVSAYYIELKALANVTFTVTIGLDTLFQMTNNTQNVLDTLTQMMNDTQNALNQTQSTAQATRNEASSANEAANEAKDEALLAKEAAESALAMANEARIYALTTMIFAIITVALSATILIKRKQT